MSHRDNIKSLISTMISSSQNSIYVLVDISGHTQKAFQSLIGYKVHLLILVFANILIMSCSITDLSCNSNFQQFTALSAISLPTPRKIHHLKSAPHQRKFKLRLFFPPPCNLSPYQSPLGRRREGPVPSQDQVGLGGALTPSPRLSLYSHRKKTCGEEAGQSYSGTFLICNLHLQWQQCLLPGLGQTALSHSILLLLFHIQSPPFQLQNSAVMKRCLGSPNALFMPQHHIHLTNRWWLMNPRNF